MPVLAERRASRPNTTEQETKTGQKKTERRYYFVVRPVWTTVDKWSHESGLYYGLLWLRYRKSQREKILSNRGLTSHHHPARACQSCLFTIVYQCVVFINGRWLRLLCRSTMVHTSTQSCPFYEKAFVQHKTPAVPHTLYAHGLFSLKIQYIFFTSYAILDRGETVGKMEARFKPMLQRYICPRGSSLDL